MIRLDLTALSCLVMMLLREARTGTPTAATYPSHLMSSESGTSELPKINGGRVIRMAPENMSTEIKPLYAPIRSLSMQMAKMKVKTGVVKVMVAESPKGTCLTEKKMHMRLNPPRKPLHANKTLVPGGPLMLTLCICKSAVIKTIWSNAR